MALCTGTGGDGEKEIRRDEANTARRQQQVNAAEGTRPLTGVSSFPSLWNVHSFRTEPRSDGTRELPPFANTLTKQVATAPPAAAVSHRDAGPPSSPQVSQPLHRLGGRRQVIWPCAPTCTVLCPQHEPSPPPGTMGDSFPPPRAALALRLLLLAQRPDWPLPACTPEGNHTGVPPPTAGVPPPTAGVGAVPRPKACSPQGVRAHGLHSS